MILVVCTLSDGALYFYGVSWKYLLRFSRYISDTILWQTDGRTDGQTWDTVLVVCTPSEDALYFYEVSWKCLEQFSSLERTRNDHYHIPKGHNLKTCIDELRSLWSACRLTKLYISMKSQRFLSYRADKNDHCQISKGNNSENV